ncbi:MAG TPA: hypothetical protein VFO90_02550 [Terrimicrobiaceae bacterium]|nr:hypothetical protein [Terrimicrobiaceae bacterium]
MSSIRKGGLANHWRNLPGSASMGPCLASHWSSALESNMTYNGWTNFQTWNVAQWLDKEESSQLVCQETAQEVYDVAEEGGGFTRIEKATFALAENLKELFESDERIPESGWMTDAVNAYLSEVNWHEIARHYVQNVVQEQTED